MELSEIERQRQLLEENVQKLRQSLKHWHTWEAEYEGLKEELIATGPEALEKDSLVEISKTYNGDLVNEKEILDLAGLKSDDLSAAKLQRSRSQILGLIARRRVGPHALQSELIFYTDCTAARAEGSKY